MKPANMMFSRRANFHPLIGNTSPLTTDVPYIEPLRKQVINYRTGAVVGQGEGN